MDLLVCMDIVYRQQLPITDANIRILQDKLMHVHTIKGGIVR